MFIDRWKRKSKLFGYSQFLRACYKIRFNSWLLTSKLGYSNTRWSIKKIKKKNYFNIDWKYYTNWGRSVINFCFVFSFTEKFFKNKLLLAFLAIVLVIKIIKIKIMWLLPLIVGVTTAKKLVLKFLLFLFPALSQIFKLCSWYHHSYHKTNFHHHQHHINHLHTVSFSFFNCINFKWFYI